MVLLETRSVSETVRLGRKIGGFLQPGDIVALDGEIGTGKTHFIKGLAAGVGIKKSTYIPSPSFTLVNEYHGKIPFYHLDLYRLETEEEAGDLGIEEYFHGEGVTAVEWADRIPSFLPRDLLWIHIGYLGLRTRSIAIEAKGSHYETVIEKLFASCRAA